MTPAGFVQPIAACRLKHRISCLPRYNAVRLADTDHPMPLPATLALCDWLRERELLSAAQVDELRPYGASLADPAAFLKYLVQRDWLTTYQANQLALGRGDDLLVGPFALLELIGEGAAGQVFKARQVRTGRIVALKIIHKEKLNNPRAVERFVREIQAAAHLAHPNIVA